MIMKITFSITVPDYVFLFYEKAATELGISKTEDLMAEALLRYAGQLSEEILSNHNHD